MTVFWIILFVVGIFLFVLSCFFLYVAVGFRKANTKKVNGYLRSADRQKNVYIGGVRGRWYKNWVEYVYVYRVGGVEYTIDGGVPGKRNSLAGTVTVIYQKSNPKRAYIDKLAWPYQYVVAPLLLVFSVLFIIPSLIELFHLY